MKIYCWKIGISFIWAAIDFVELLALLNVPHNIKLRHAYAIAYQTPGCG